MIIRSSFRDSEGLELAGSHGVEGIPESGYGHPSLRLLTLPSVMSSISLKMQVPSATIHEHEPATAAATTRD